VVLTNGGFWEESDVTDPFPESGVNPASRDEALETVRARTDIVELIGRYLKLKKVGGRYVGLCPFHTEKTPSFSVNPQKGFFHCFGCKASGDVFTFVMRMNGKSFPEALGELAERAGVELPAQRRVDPEQRERKQRYLDVLERAAAFYEDELRRQDPGQAVSRYMRERGLSEGVAKRYRLGYAPSGWQNLLDRFSAWKASGEDGKAVGLLVEGKRGPYDMFRNRLIFPIAGLDDRVHGFGARKLDPDDHGGKYINSPQGPVYDKSEMLYGLSQARSAIQRSGRTLLVEGYFDVLSLVDAGFEDVVATSGTALTEGHARLLKRFCDRVVCVFDADPAGLKASFRAAEVLLAQDVSPYMLSLPEGEDPDSFVRNRGPDAFSSLLDMAKPTLEVLADRLAAGAGTDVEARTRAVERLMPLLRACKGGIRLGGYLQLVAERFRLSEQDLRKALGGRPAKEPPSRADAPEPSLTTPQASVDELRLASLLLQHPPLAQQVIADHAQLDIQSPSIRQLVEEIRADPSEISVAARVSQLQNAQDRDWLSADLVHANERTPDGAQADLQLHLRRLRLTSLQQQKRDLDGRMAELAQQGEETELRTLKTARLAVGKEIQALDLAVKVMP
jgi:DNA primase